jgi:hypothetical protein
MDLRVYYQKLRQIESELKDPFPVVISRETTDGGIQGVLTQTSRNIAARLIADGKVDLASDEETAQFLARIQKEWRDAREEAGQAAPNKPAPKRAKAPKTLLPQPKAVAAISALNADATTSSGAPQKS